jgi:hypothetical protein
MGKQIKEWSRIEKKRYFKGIAKCLWSSYENLKRYGIS